MSDEYDSSYSASDDDNNNSSNQNEHDSDVENMEYLSQDKSQDIKPEPDDDVGGSSSGSSRSIISNAASFKFGDLYEPDKIKLTHLIKNVECVACKEIPMAEIYSCTSGHIICKKCIEIVSCPKCSKPNSDTRNILAEKMVASLKFKCKNRSPEEDCPKILSFEDIDKHMTDKCEFRPVPCYVGTDGKRLCNGKLIPFEKYLDHVKRSHPPLPSDKSTRKLELDSVTKDYLWPLQCISFDGQLFFQHVLYLDSVVYIWLTLFGSQGVQSCNTYSAIVSLEKKSEPNQKNMNVSSKIRVLNFRKQLAEVLAERAYLTLSKEEFVVFSSNIIMADEEQGNEEIQNDDVIVYKYLWILKTTMCKDDVENSASDDELALSYGDRMTKIRSRQSNKNNEKNRRKKRRRSRSSS